MRVALEDGYKLLIRVLCSTNLPDAADVPSIWKLHRVSDAYVAKVAGEYNATLAKEVETAEVDLVLHFPSATRSANAQDGRNARDL